MLTVPLLLAAAGTACWPQPAGAVRLRALSGGGRRWAFPRCGASLLVGLGIATGWWLLGVAGAAAAALFGVTAVRQRRARRAWRERAAALSGMVEALGHLVGELRAGAHPALAAESVARDAEPAVASALHCIAAAVRLGGEAELALPRAIMGRSATGEALERIAGAWALAQRHGLPLAEVLDAARRDLEATVRFDGALHARMAGPRSSAAVLAGLPVLGLLLGEAMGAAPLQVLGDTAAGQVLVVLGAGLIWAGLRWSARITRAVTAP